MSRFMTGLLLGVGLGLLMAPEKGEDTREAIADTAESWKNKINKLVGRAGAEIDDIRKLLDSEISGLSEDVRSRIRTILDEEENGSMAAKRSYEFKDEFKPI